MAMERVIAPTFVSSVHRVFSQKSSSISSKANTSLYSLILELYHAGHFGPVALCWWNHTGTLTEAREARFG